MPHRILCLLGLLFVAFATPVHAEDKPGPWSDEVLFSHPRPESLRFGGMGDRARWIAEMERLLDRMTDQKIVACLPEQSPLIHHHCPNCVRSRGMNSHTTRNWKHVTPYVFDPNKPDQYACKACGEVYPDNPRFPKNLTLEMETPKLSEGGPRGRKVKVHYYYNKATGRRYCFDGVLDTIRDKFCQDLMRNFARAYHETRDERYAEKVALMVNAYATRFRDWLLVQGYGEDYLDAAGRDWPYGWTDTRYGRRASGESNGPGYMITATDICWNSKAFDVMSERIGEDLRRKAIDTVYMAKNRYGGGLGKFHQGYPVYGRFNFARLAHDRETFRLFTQACEKMPQVSFTVDGGYTEGPGYWCIHLWRADEALRAINGYTDPPDYKTPGDGKNAKLWAEAFPQGDVPYQGRVVDWQFPRGRYEDFWARAFKCLPEIRMPSGGHPIFNDCGHGYLGRAPFLYRPPRVRSDDIMKPGLRHVVLGDGAGDDQVQVHMGFGLSTNHGHQDTLDMQLFAKGHYLIDDLSYPKHALRITYSGAFGHNVVIVDHENQGAAYADGDVVYYEPNLPGFSVARVAAPRAYANKTTRYERTLALNTVDPERPYVIDLFVVEGGKVRDYMMRSSKLSPSTQSTSLKARPVPGLRPLLPDGVEWVDEFADYLSGYGVLFNVRQAAAPDYFTVDYKLKDPWPGVQRMVDGKEVVHHGKTGRAELPYKATDTSWSDKPAIGVRHHYVSDDSYTAILAEMPWSGGMDSSQPSESWRRMPAFLLRHEGEGGKAQFVAIHEPWSGAPAIRAVRRLPVQGADNAIVLEVEFDNRTDTVFLSTDTDPFRARVKGIRFDGRIGMAVRQGERSDAYLIGGTDLMAADHKLSAVAAEYQGVVTRSLRRWNADAVDGFFVEAEQALPASLVGSWVMLTNNGKLDDSPRMGRPDLDFTRLIDWAEYKLKHLRRDYESAGNLTYEQADALTRKSPIGRYVERMKQKVADRREHLVNGGGGWTFRIAGIEQRDGKTFMRLDSDSGLDIDGDSLKEYFFPQRWQTGATHFVVYPATSTAAEVAVAPAGGAFLEPVTVRCRSLSADPEAAVQYAILPPEGEGAPEQPLADRDWQTCDGTLEIDRDSTLVVRSITPRGVKTPLERRYDWRIATDPAASKELVAGKLIETRAGQSDASAARSLYPAGDARGRYLLRGRLNVPRDGVYTFHFRPTGDGSMTIGDHAVFARREIPGTPMPRTADVPLKRGQYPLSIEINGRRDVELEWQGPGVERRRLSDDDYGCHPEA